MNLRFDTNSRQWVSADELVSVYECTDGTWRVAYFPYADKDRGLTKEQAFALAEVRWQEAVQTYAASSA